MTLGTGGSQSELRTRPGIVFVAFLQHSGLAVTGCLLCKLPQGRSARCHTLKDLVACSFASAGVPDTKEPVGLFRTDVKRPDGVTLVGSSHGRVVSHYVVTSLLQKSVTCPVVESYLSGCSCSSRDGSFPQGEVCRYRLTSLSWSQLR